MATKVARVESRSSTLPPLQLREVAKERPPQPTHPPSQRQRGPPPSPLTQLKSRHTLPLPPSTPPTTKPSATGGAKTSRAAASTRAWTTRDVAVTVPPSRSSRPVRLWREGGGGGWLEGWTDTLEGDRDENRYDMCRVSMFGKSAVEKFL